MNCSNRQYALHWIYKNRTVKRAELVQELAISQASTLRLVTELLAQGYLVENESVDAPTGRGRPSSVLGINPECGIVTGIEFGRDELRIAFATADGAQIGWCDIEDTPPYDPAAETLDKLIQIAHREAQKFELRPENIRAVGLAVHDLVTVDGKWVKLAQPPGPPFCAREYIANKYNYFVHVEDVSRAFAFAEHRFGAGRGITDMIYLFVGRQGIGSGIFVNNQLLKSASGFCGEVGHIQVEEGGLLCQCGNQGCLETAAKYDAILDQIHARLQVGVISSLSQKDCLSITDVCQAYKDGDKVARIVFSQLANNISKALVSTINIVGASHILIGGKLYQAGDDFAHELTSRLHQQLIPGLTHDIAVSFAALSDKAGAWGVATQALDSAWEAGYFLDENQ